MSVDQYMFEDRNKSPEQMGIPIVETLSAGSDGTVYVDTSNNIAKQLMDDAFPVDYTDFAGVTGGIDSYGIIYIKHSGSYLGSGDIHSDTGDTQTAENRIYFDAGSGVSSGDSVEVAYYAIGRGYSDDGSSDQTETLLRPDKSYTNSFELTEEIYRGLVNAMDFKSPINLAEAGWKYADQMFYEMIDISTLSGYDSSGNHLTIMDTDDTDISYVVERDEDFPFIVTEIRVIVPEDETDSKVPDVSVELDAQFDRGSTDKKDIGEGRDAGTKQDRIPFRYSRIVHVSGDGGYKMRIRIGMVKSNRMKVYLYTDSAWPTGEGQDNDVKVSMSGYYMPLWGGDEP